MRNEPYGGRGPRSSCHVHPGLLALVIMICVSPPSLAQSVSNSMLVRTANARLFDGGPVIVGQETPEGLLASDTATNAEGSATLMARAYSPQHAYMGVESAAELTYDADSTYNPGGWGEAEVRRVSLIQLPSALVKIVVSMDIETLHTNSAHASGFLVLTLDTGEEVFSAQESVTGDFLIDARPNKKLELNLSLRVFGELQAGPDGSSAAWATASVIVINSIDCNRNGVPDEIDIATGAAHDCNENLVPDRCERDCNRNGLHDDCDIADGVSEDCNGNQKPDECDAYQLALDCDLNGQVDSCEILADPELDCDSSRKLDACELVGGVLDDCDEDAQPDVCQIASGSAEDCDGNAIPDHCDLAMEQAFDCNGNAVPDHCDVAADPTADTDHNGFLDECEVILYVDSRAAGLNNGQDWNNAYTTLDAALAHANAAGGAVPEIRVAQGTYRPSHRLDAHDPRSATFLIAESVAVHGGFVGIGGFDPDVQHPWGYPTILTGDLNSDDGSYYPNLSDNAYHVVLSQAPWARLQGLIVKAGRADAYADIESGGGILVFGSMLEVLDCQFSRNFAEDPYETTAAALSGCTTSRGGGAIYAPEATLIVENSNFSYNFALYGGAIVARSLSLKGSYFTANEARCGGAVAVNGGDALVQATEFYRNTAVNRGGALIASGLELTVQNCEFTYNSAYYGGALNLSIFEQTTIDQSTFWRNSAQLTGGAIFSSFQNTSFCVSRGKFEDNTAVGMGGAIYAQETIRLKDTTFANNKSGAGGGAAACPTMDIWNCVFRENIAPEGGALLNTFRFADPVPSKISNSIFEVNSALLGGGASLAEAIVDRCRFAADDADVGGALAIAADIGYQSLVRNSLIVQNYARWYGGGIIAGTENVCIRNCTVLANEAELMGGGIVAAPGMTLTNSLLWVNRLPNSSTLEAQIDGYASIDLTYNIIEGWPNPSADSNSGEGPISSRPQPNSPAIDSGDPDFVPEPGEADLDGKPRVLCGRVDRGAFEFGVVGDMNCDRALTLADFAEWPACETGPGEPQPLGDCQALDAHVDGSLDLRDFAKLQAAFTPPTDGGD